MIFSVDGLLADGIWRGFILTWYLQGVQATAYLNKLPASLSADDRILVVDPMLATGESSFTWALQNRRN